MRVVWKYLCFIYLSLILAKKHSKQLRDHYLKLDKELYITVSVKPNGCTPDLLTAYRL